jgi:hypothetical protein
VTADVDDDESPCADLGHLSEFIADEDEDYLVFNCRACGAEWEEAK